MHITSDARKMFDARYGYDNLLLPTPAMSSGIARFSTGDDIICG